MDESAQPYLPQPPYQPYPQPPLGDVPFAAPPAAPRGRRYLPYLLAFGALVIAAGGYLAGSAHARSGTGGSAGASASGTVVGGSAPAGAVNAAAATPAAPGCQTTPRRGVVGTLKAVSGSSFTVSGRDGATTTVHTSASTTIRKTESGALTDIKNGAVVAVRGTSSGTNAISAAQVNLVDKPANAPATPKPTPAPAPAPGSPTAPVRPRASGVAVGTVSDVTPTGFTVTQGTTKFTVTTSATTKVVKTVTATLDQLTIGQPVAVAGTANADGSFAATQVAQGAAGTGPGINGLPGPGGFPGPRGPGFGGGGPGAGRPAGGARPTTPPSTVA